MDWSQKRKIIYAVMFAVAVIAIVSYPVYQIVHEDPVCFDGKMNGTETGVDCGGTCVKACTSEMKSIRTAWVKTFPLEGGMYDLGAYIENLNSSTGIKKLRYTLRILDAKGSVLAERKGESELPPSSGLLLFKTGITLSGDIDHADIVFNEEDINHWTRATIAPSMITTKNQVLKNTDTKPRFDALLVNNDLVNKVSNLTLGAIVYDAMRHPVAISSTYVSEIEKDSQQPIFFTWPNRFTKNPRGGMCTTPVDTMLVFDRSGSMDIGRKNPPEPLTTAKNAAGDYVDVADIVDKVGVITFANTATEPIDHELSLDHDSVRKSVTSIEIGKNGLQHTNLGDAIRSALRELGSTRHTKDAKKIIVALTDGVANRPLDPVRQRENIAYSEEYAVNASKDAQNDGVEVYAIGLGSGINESFLRDRVASSPSHYFNAPTANDLNLVYKKISETVCKTENFITEIVVTPRAVFAQ